MAATAVAEGIWRLGTSYINWYLIGDKDAYTLVDTGLPRYWPQLLVLLNELHAAPTQIRAIVITHHHPDHRGNIRRAYETTHALPYAHRADHGHVRGDEKLRTRGLARFLLRPWYMKYFTHLVSNGVRRAQFHDDLREITDGESLDVPGNPTVIHVPGHTLGSCALLLRDRGVLLSGDALVTLDTSTGYRGPSIIRGPVTDDAALAERSLERLADLEADVVLPGHGEPWTDGLGSAVARVRRIQT